MIASKKDYRDYLEADRIALGVDLSSLASRVIELISPNPIWKFQKGLRKREYYRNCRTDLLGKLYYGFLKLKSRKLSVVLGFSIPENVFGPGLAIVHYGTLVVNEAAKVGKNCRIHASVNIGASGGSPKAPQLGDNVYIGPGSVLFGDISIGNNVAISANSTVNKSCDQDGVLLAGSPAKVIKEYDVTQIIKHLKSEN